ncbi:hypothetical protein NPIRD3C_1128 [Nitrosopumilus piranensis]|uniref:Uncharacterized protein n=1 Tax=Nitrosopumilus piranensis TaxID=1582439 RepID=A0A0C5BZB4_9ARCH|nr:hypothetical protein NPIRD3C_1128 [Nitrosopumilus piranensis]
MRKMWFGMLLCIVRIWNKGNGLIIDWIKQNKNNKKSVYSLSSFSRA